ncbi:hypothetical protein HII12_000335 [Brettanomyces bruxellensis]|uniref:Trafficking protein particle complex III-specific subunit 85 n=1 Tax=Dekkera bruxellensis TaxID=5007 RepID=A0A8H6BRM5_DEKBR|nr:hypothetical protein HII12_000335 [Brettanomyces bruxellensis]
MATSNWSILDTKYAKQVNSLIAPDFTGVSSLIARQAILKGYCPKVSVHSSPTADHVARNYGFSNFLSFLRFFEYDLADSDFCLPSDKGEPNRIVIKFVDSIEHIIEIQDANKGSFQGQSAPEKPAGRFPELYGEHVLTNTVSRHMDRVNNEIEKTSFYTNARSFLWNAKDLESECPEVQNSKVQNSKVQDSKVQDSKVQDSKAQDSKIQDSKVRVEQLEGSIYLSMLSKATSSNTLVPFEFINHPVVNLVVITADITIRDLQAVYSDQKRKYLDLHARFPWLDTSCMMTLFLILVDTDAVEQFQALSGLQDYCVSVLGEDSIGCTFSFEKASNSDAGLPLEKIHADSLDFAAAAKLRPDSMLSVEIAKKVAKPIHAAVDTIVYKKMVPFLRRKIQKWHEEYVVPRKSLTGRLLGAGRLWGSNSSHRSFFSFGYGKEKSESSESGAGDADSTLYNAQQGYYPSASPFVFLRRLGDWYFMMRDYKNAYTVYEMLKKQYLADRAYGYLSSLQEFMIVSLLLGASCKVNPLEKATDGKRVSGITAKIVSDVIAPFLDSSFYSYLSRCSLKTYTIRLTLVTAELFLVLGQSVAYCHERLFSRYALSSEACFIESQKLFKRLIDSKLVDNVCTGVLMQRLSYIYYCNDKPGVSGSEEDNRLQRKSYYTEFNPEKLTFSPTSHFGASRSRKSILWMLLCAKTLDPVINRTQVTLVLWYIENKLRQTFHLGPESTVAWPYRKGSLFVALKASLE